MTAPRQLLRSAAGLLLLGLALCATPALADDRRGGRGGRGRHGVPEFDPAVAGAIAALMAGGSVLVARKRK